MKRLAMTLALGLAASVTSFALPGGGENWMDDYDAAVEVAKKEGKHLLVDFTGSDWCGWCIRLNKEVFSHEAWEAEASKEYVFVALDFPQAEEIKAKVPNPKRNKELGEQFGVKGYPTILLMTATGDVFGRTGYQKGGPEKYLEHMAELKKNGLPQLEAVLKLTKEYKAAEGDAQIVLWDKVASMLEKNGAESAGARHLLSVVKEGLTLDPKNEKGLGAKALTALFAAGQYSTKNFDLAKLWDAKNATGLYEKALGARTGSVREEADVDSFLAEAAAFHTVNKIVDKSVGLDIYAYAALYAKRAKNDDALAATYADKAAELGGLEHEMYGRLLKDMVSSAGEHNHGEDGHSHDGDEGHEEKTEGDKKDADGK